MMQATTFYVHIGLSILSALAGLFHIVYCSLFYTSVIGIWNAVLLLATGMYGVYQNRPGSLFLVYSHAVLFMAGLVVLSLNSVGLHCTHRSCTAETWSRPIQQKCLSKFADSPALLQGMGRIHTAIHGLLIVESIIQMGVALGIIWMHIFAFMNQISKHLNQHYLHMILGIMSFTFGTVHTLYCSHLFYIGCGLWCSTMIIVSSIFTNYVRNINIPVPAKMNDQGSSWALSTSPRFSSGSDLSCQLRREIESRVSAGHMNETVVVENVNDNKKSSMHRLWTTVRVLSWMSILAGLVLAAVASFGAYCWHPVPSKLIPIKLEGNVTWLDIPSSCAPPSTDPFIYDKCYANLENYGFWDHTSDPGFKGLARLQKAMTLLILMCGVASAIFGLYNEFKLCKVTVKSQSVPTVV